MSMPQCNDGGHILDVLDESSIEANMRAIKGRIQIIKTLYCFEHAAEKDGELRFSISEYFQITSVLIFFIE
jgi:hypothetical protein